MLRDSKSGDLALPIAGFNPMAKEHILLKLKELTALCAEQIVQDTLDRINAILIGPHDGSVFKVVLNLADDLKGGWTNSFTADYDSKFKINALVTRGFCTPFFWTSESYSEELIERRTLEYAFRTVHWLTTPKPKTLRDHVEQEAFVAKMSRLTPENLESNDLKLLDSFYSRHHESEDYGIVFNFLYGDEASKSLEFATHGVTGKANGFDYARIIHSRRIQHVS